MPDSTADEVYSTPQINIPPTFPFILKQYAKAALRTQPYDLLRWSASYFRALAKGEEPPIKDRLEYPPPDTPSGLSPGYLKVLIKQIGKGGTVTLGELVDRWNGICLAEEPLMEMLAVGQFGESFEWLHFVAIAAGFLSNNLTQTMVLLCNLLTDEPDGGSAVIPLHTFTKLYTFLASLDCGEPDDREDENESHHEYIMTEGLRDDVSLYYHDSASLKRESVESCPTDPSIYQVNWGSNSAHQIFAETHSPYPSPLSSRPCTPCITMENASTTTLTPLNQHCISQEQGAGSEAHLETFYDAKVEEKGSGSGSMRSSQELIDAGKDSNENRSISCTTSNVSVPSTDATATLTTLKRKSSNGHGDVDEKAASASTLSSQKGVMKSKRSADKRASERQYVPGIGAVVDAVQIQAVVDYLEGVGLKQEGMVKPSNIRHFLCPPLEKVPASQKTRV